MALTVATGPVESSVVVTLAGILVEQTMGSNPCR
jgi:hypothetical protein